EGSPVSVAFSPDGTRVVTASQDGTARVWEARTGATVGPPLRHDGPVRSGAFSPDGTQVVTASEDETAQVWEGRTGAGGGGGRGAGCGTKAASGRRCSARTGSGW